MSQQHVQKLHLLQQNLQNIANQKQQFSAQLAEIESAIKEVPNSSSTYKIVGKLMVAQDAATLTKELEEQETLIKLRISTIEKQELSVKETLEKTQKEMLDTIKEQDTSKE